MANQNDVAGRIFTHVHVDVDAALSAAAVRIFVSGYAEAEVVHVPAFWDGTSGRDGNLPEWQEGDAAVDIPAGGRGIKGRQEADGTVHSALEALVAEHCSAEQQAALEKLVSTVDASDSGQAAWGAGGIGLPQVLAAIREAGGREGDVKAVAFAEDFLRGHLKMELSRLRAAAEADMAEVVTSESGNVNVAIVRGARERGTNAELYGRGVHAIVFADGNNLGLTRPPTHSFRVDTDAVKEVIGDEEGWFYHPAGFLAARGSFKAPATSPSAVDPRALAEAAAESIDEQLTR